MERAANFIHQYIVMAVDTTDYFLVVIVFVYLIFVLLNHHTQQRNKIT